MFAYSTKHIKAYDKYNIVYPQILKIHPHVITGKRKHII